MKILEQPLKKIVQEEFRLVQEEDKWRLKIKRIENSKKMEDKFSYYVRISLYYSLFLLWEDFSKFVSLDTNNSLKFDEWIFISLPAKNIPPGAKICFRVYKTLNTVSDCEKDECIGWVNDFVWDDQGKKKKKIFLHLYSKKKLKRNH